MSMGLVHLLILVCKHGYAICRIDVVLLSGDLANFPMEKMTTASEDELKEQHQILDRVVSEFLPLAKQVFYIPGNVNLSHSMNIRFSTLILYILTARCDNQLSHNGLLGVSRQCSLEACDRGSSS